jgi:hypothetical protein
MYENREIVFIEIYLDLESRISAPFFTSKTV